MRGAQGFFGPLNSLEPKIPRSGPRLAIEWQANCNGMFVQADVDARTRHVQMKRTPKDQEGRVR
jgi:hypothetical protein